jgi:Ca-activated chloride channel family protein
MSFGAPLFLAALVLIPLGLVLYARRERRPGREAFAPAALLPSVAPHRPRWRRHVPVALYTLALAVLIVALARPQTTVAEPVEQATVIMVIDRSGSMAATDVAPTRLEAAQAAARTFLDSIPDDVKVGLVAYNHSAQVLESPTAQHPAVAAAIDAIEPAGSTATGDALEAALRLIATQRTLASPKAPAAVVLLSDGKSVRGDTQPLEAAANAKRAKVPVYTVSLGTAGGTITSKGPNGTTKQEPVPPDPATLGEIARIAGGETFATADAARLKAVYERLGSEVATEKVKREVTSSFAGGALALLVLGAVAGLRWFGRPL